MNESVDYKAHFYANNRAFFIIFALYAPVDLVETLLKGVPHFFELGPLYIVSLVLFLVGATTAAITRNERYHQFYAIFFLLQTIIISFRLFQTLAEQTAVIKYSSFK